MLSEIPSFASWVSCPSKSGESEGICDDLQRFPEFSIFAASRREITSGWLVGNGPTAEG
jgi:hypothetical protein